MAQFHDLIQSDHPFRLLVHAYATFNEFYVRSHSGVSTADIRDGVVMTTLAVLVPAIHLRAGANLLVSRPFNSVHFALFRFPNIVERTLIEFGPNSVLGNVTISGTRIRAVFGAGSRILGVYAQTMTVASAADALFLEFLEGE